LRIARYNRLALLFYLIVLAFSAPLALAIVQRWQLIQQVVVILWVGLTGGIVAHLVLEGLPLAGDEDADDLLQRLSGALGLDSPARRGPTGRWAFWLEPPKSLVFSSGDELGRAGEWLQARVVISNTALQPREVREAGLAAAEATALSEGLLGLKLATAVAGGTGDRRLWLDQAKSGSTEAPRAVLVDGFRRRDLGYHNYIVVGTVHRSAQGGSKKVWSNDLMRLICDEDHQAADEVERLVHQWERKSAAGSAQAPRAEVIVRPSPFRPVWDLDKTVVVLVGHDEASLAATVGEAFRDNRGFVLPDEDQFTLVKRRTGRFFREFRFGEALAAFVVLIASILLKPYYSQAWFSFRRNLPTLTPRFWAYLICSVALGVIVGTVVWVRGEKKILEKLAGSAFGLLNRMAARAEWARRSGQAADPDDAGRPTAGRPTAAGSATAGPTSLGQFIELVTRGSTEPLIVVGSTFGDHLTGASLRNLLGLPFRMDTVDLALAYELMDALGLATLGDNFRVAHVAGLNPGSSTAAGGPQGLGLSLDEVKGRDLIVLGSPLANSFTNCLFRCGADYRGSEWGRWADGRGDGEAAGSIRPGGCPFEDCCELGGTMAARAAETGHAPLHPWTLEPEMIAAKRRGGPVSYGFPWDTDAGLVHLVPNPAAPGHSVLVVFGYHRTGTDAAVSAVVAQAVGHGPVEARDSSYVVIKKQRDKKLVCLDKGNRDE
jgi:hypothetical protein